MNVYAVSETILTSICPLPGNVITEGSLYLSSFSLRGLTLNQ